MDPAPSDQGADQGIPGRDAGADSANLVRTTHSLERRCS